MRGDVLEQQAPLPSLIHARTHTHPRTHTPHRPTHPQPARTTQTRTWSLPPHRTPVRTRTHTLTFRAIAAAVQTHFVQKAILRIVGLYEHSMASSAGIVLVGHSMGGLVARAAAAFAGMAWHGIALPPVCAARPPLDAKNL